MSSDFSASAIIGIKIKIPTKTHYEKIGKHDFDTSVIYHPKTGVKLWRVYERPIYSLIKEDLEEDQRLIETPYEIVSLHEDNTYIVGIGVTCKSSWTEAKMIKGIYLPNPSKLTNILFDTFNVYGLWKADNFGLWAVNRFD